jgi:hypothetical protein
MSDSEIVELHNEALRDKATRASRQGFLNFFGYPRRVNSKDH